MIVFPGSKRGSSNREPALAKISLLIAQCSTGERNDPTKQSVCTTILYIARSREKAGEFSVGEGRERERPSN